jgi:hypothetical protein
VCGLQEWDQFHDVWYWVHQKTGKARTTMPTLEEFMPKVRRSHAC